MKYLIFLLALAFSFQSCKKNSPDDQSGNDVKPFFNSASGSIWNYHQINSSDGTPIETDYTITSTSRDTTINNKTYHVYNYSFGGNQYLNKTNEDYYQYENFADLGESIERLYLKGKSKVNSSWSQDFSFPIPNLPISVRFKLNNQILDIGTRVVNSTSYSDVVHVRTTITSPDIPADKLTSEIDSYYAPEYGLIENTTKVALNYMGYNLNVDVKTLLTSASLQ